MSTLLARVFARLTKGRGPARRPRICKAAAGDAFAKCIQSIATTPRIFIAPTTPQSIADKTSVANSQSIAHKASITAATPTSASTLLLVLLLTFLAATTHADNAAIYTRRIGINVTPTTELEVSGTISATSIVLNGVTFTGSGTTANVSVTTGASGSIVYRDAYGGLLASSLFSISSTTGSVGIGAGAPASLGSNGLYASGNIQGAYVTANAYYMGGPTGSLRWGGDVDIIGGNGGSTQHYLTFTTSGTEAMRIVSTGYVGIGTTSPNAQVTVNTTATDIASLNLSNSNPNQTSIFNISGPLSTNTTIGKAFSINASGEYMARGVFYTDGSYGWGRGGNSNRDLYMSRPVTSTLLLSSDRATGAANLRVTSWTTIASSVTPTAELDVYGTVSGSRFVGDGSGLTGIVASSNGDNIASGTTRVTANTTGYVSFTTGGTTTGYMDTWGNFILPGISTTAVVSANTIFAGAGGIATVGNIDMGGGNFGSPQRRVARVRELHNDEAAGITLYTTTSGGPIIFRPSNTEAMRIVSTGYVGIGTSSPNSKLDVNGTISASYLYAYSPVDGGAQIDAFNPLNSNAHLYMGWINNTGRIRIGGTGAGASSSIDLQGPSNISYLKVGPYGTSVLVASSSTPSASLHVSGTILTTSWTGINFSSGSNVTPTAPLEVSGTVSATRFVGDGSLLTGIVGASSGDNIASGTTKVTANTTGYVSFTTGGTTTGYMDTAGNFILPGVSTTAAVSAGTTGYFGGNVTIANGSALIVDGSTHKNVWNRGSLLTLSNLNGGGGLDFTSTDGSTSWMRIVSSGQVGINVTNPSATLHVGGISMFDYSWPANSTPQVIVGKNNGGGAGRIAFRRATDGNAVAAIGYTSSTESNEFSISSGGGAGYLTFITGGPSSQERMRIASTTGYVGIGTQSSTAPLEVSGTVSATRFVGDGSGLTGIVGASSGDTITSGTTRVTANTTGYVSFTTGGTTTGYMNTAGVFVLPGVSTTGTISGTGGFFSSGVQVQGALDLGGTSSSPRNITRLRLLSNDETVGVTISTTGAVGAGPIVFAPSSTEAMRIVSTGYVGIGTGAPSATLHVSGTGYFTSPVGIGTAPQAGYDLYAIGQIRTNNNVIVGNNQNLMWGDGTTYIRGRTDQQFMAFNTSSTEQMRIVSTGYVGIGTANPSTSLDVSGSLTVRNSGSSSLRLTTNQLYTNIGPLYLNHGNGQNLIVNGLGNTGSLVGIGTTTPTTALEVSGTISATNFVGNGSLLTGVSAGSVSTGASGSIVYRDGSGNLAANSSLVISSTQIILGSIPPWFGSAYSNAIYATNGYYTAQNYIAGDAKTYGWGDGTTSIYGQSTNKYMSFYTSATEAMRIVSTGLVGIGTTAPDTTAQLTVGNPNSSLGAIIIRRGSGNEPAIGLYAGTNTNASATQIRGLVDGGLRVTDGSGSNEYVRIVSTGYVGIGTTAPAGLLDISGTTGRAFIDSAGTSLSFTRAGDNYLRASATGGKLNLVTNGNTRLLVDSIGNVGIGTATIAASSTLHVSGTTRITSWTYIGDNQSPTTALEVAGTVSATGVRVTGDIYYSGTLNDTSDRRLKTNIRPLPYNDVLDRLMLLKPVQYERKAVPGRIEWGFIAQDVERQFPQLVTAANDPSGTKSISYLGLLPPMVQAIQQLKTDNDSLRAQVSTLKAANDNLTGRLDAQQQKLESQQRDIDALKKLNALR